MKTLEELLLHESAYYLNGIFIPDKTEGKKLLDFTEETIKAELKASLEYLAYKADNQRGISTECAIDLVSFWMFALDLDFDSPQFKPERDYFDSPQFYIDDSDFIYYMFKRIVGRCQKIADFFEWGDVLDNYYKSINQ